MERRGQSKKKNNQKKKRSCKSVTSLKFKVDESDFFFFLLLFFRNSCQRQLGEKVKSSFQPGKALSAVLGSSFNIKTIQFRTNGSHRRILSNLFSIHSGSHPLPVRPSGLFFFQSR